MPAFMPERRRRSQPDVKCDRRAGAVAAMACPATRAVARLAHSRAGLSPARAHGGRMILKVVTACAFLIALGTAADADEPAKAPENTQPTGAATSDKPAADSSQASTPATATPVAAPV